MKSVSSMKSGSEGREGNPGGQYEFKYEFKICLMYFEFLGHQSVP